MIQKTINANNKTVSKNCNKKTRKQKNNLGTKLKTRTKYKIY